jgi:hypothetical protein
MTSNVILDLVSIPKHRTALGVDCETYASSLPSMFKPEPMDTTVFVVLLAHLTIEKVYRAHAIPRLVFWCPSTNPKPLLDGETASEQGSDRQERTSSDEVSEQDEAPTLEYRWEIFDIIRAGSTPSKSYIPVNKERKQRVKSLSTRQLFHGVYDSPTRDSPIRCKHDMLESFWASFAEARLKRFYKYQPNVTALRRLMAAMTRRAKIPYPLERSRIAIIQWLGTH